MSKYIIIILYFIVFSNRDGGGDARDAYDAHDDAYDDHDDGDDDLNIFCGEIQIETVSRKH